MVDVWQVGHGSDSLCKIPTASFDFMPAINRYDSVLGEITRRSELQKISPSRPSLAFSRDHHSITAQ